MLDYKEIIIKHYGGGISGGELAGQKLGSKSGINDFLRAFEACEKISYPLPEGITNYGIAELVYGPSAASHNAGRNLSYEQPDYSKVHAEMTGRKNMTMIYQWNKYKRRCEDEEKKAYSYRQFCSNYDSWCEENEETMHFQAVIAQKMEIDFAGKTFNITDGYTGEICSVVVFVAILPYSQYIYAEGITEQNASRKKPDETYQELLDLLPEEDVQKACEEFKAKVWELARRFMKGQAYYDREINRVIKEMENSQAVAPFATMPGKKVLPGLGGTPLDLMGMSGLPGVLPGGIGGLPGGTRQGGNTPFDIARRGKELMDQSHDYDLDFDRYLWMDRKAVRRESGSREVADATADFMVSNPYELCFALFYLMDTGDDAPWLIRSGSSLMLYVLRMLPWHVEQDDWDDEDWNAWYDGLQYNRDGWLEQEKVEEPVDFYHERHGDRNLAQVIYDLCRTVVPTGLHPFEKDRARLVSEGMDDNLARKITDTAELLFLYEFQARQQVSVDVFPGINDEPAVMEPSTKPASTAPASPVRLGGYWGKVMGQSEESHSDAEREDTLKLKAEADELRKQLKSLKNALAITRQEANNERARYEHELKALRMEHRELADLRELVFNREQDDQERREKVEKSYEYPYSTRKRTVVFGGHDSFLRAIKPMLPDVKFVDAGNMTYSPDIIRNADVVWIQNNCISHPQFWSIVKNCKLAGVQMRYFGFASAEKCAEQLVTEDLK